MATAFAALVSLQNNLDLIQNHPRHSFSFEDKQIESLCESVSFLIEFMESFDDSHGATKEAAEALERRIACAAHAAEDVIESHVVDQIRAGSTLDGKTRSRFLLDLQKVIGDMDFIRRKAVNIEKSQSGFKAEQPTFSAAAATSSTPLASQKNRMVGFDDGLLQLVDLLTGVPSSRQVIPIVGMGGIGKTTLARNAFQHSCIVHYFDVCLWATVSQQYSVEKVLTQLLSRLRKFTSKTVDESTSGTVAELREELHKSLYGRRYLIILDDMWSVEAWDDIKFFVPDTGNGSRIVVTSRHSDVVAHLNVCYLKMSPLDEDNSWDLFCQKAFDERSCPPELEEIGKKIVGKCKGLPLAIVVVGGHLRKSSMTLDYWEDVAHHMNSILNSTENEECLNVLSLSYSYLPAHLKPCFLYMGVFLEDQEIYMWDILKLWIAEGFILLFDYTSLEEAAEDYLWDLFDRNLIFVDELGFNGEIINFKVHDLVRELCLKIAKKDEFLYVLDTPQAINRERRVVINEKVPEVNHQTNIFHAPRTTPLVRSLICKGGRLSYDLKLLRVLNKVDSASTNEANFRQVNLRYLKVDLFYKSRPTLYLPSSISLLWNLQILTINTASLSIIVAPYEIWEMLQLRHLEVDPICLLDPLPMDSLDQANDLVLRNLHTLLRVENFRLSEEVCKRIANVKELQVSYSDLGRDCDEARSYYCPHNLGCFHQLEYIVCKFDHNSKWRDFALSLTFPSSLKWLSLSGSRLDWEELTVMVGSLPHLLSLELNPNSVIGSVWTPIEGKFLRLKYLSIQSCDDLMYWNVENSHFPVLEALYLANLSKLDGFPTGIGEIPTLRWLDLRFCSMSSTISAMRTLVEQEEQGNEGLRFFVYFQGDEETLESFEQKVEKEGLRSNNLILHVQDVKTKGS